MAKKNKPGKDAKKDDKKVVKAKVKKGADKKPVAKKAAFPAPVAKKAAVKKAAAPKAAVKKTAAKKAEVGKAAPAKKAVPAKPVPSKFAKGVPKAPGGKPRQTAPMAAGRARSAGSNAIRVGLPRLVSSTPPELLVVPDGMTLAAGQSLAQFIGSPQDGVSTSACLKLSNELVFSLALSVDPAVRAQQIEQIGAILVAFLGSWEDAASLITLGESCNKN